MSNHSRGTTHRDSQSNLDRGNKPGKRWSEGTLSPESGTNSTNQHSRNSSRNRSTRNRGSENSFREKQLTVRTFRVNESTSAGTEYDQKSPRVMKDKSKTATHTRQKLELDDEASNFEKSFNDPNNSKDRFDTKDKLDKGGTSREDSCVTEIKGDLFTASDDVSLVHCVGADFRMESGIAVSFRDKFKAIGKLLDQRIKPGGVASIKLDRRHIFYLVIKQVSSDKPTLETMRNSLIALREECEKSHLTKLAMPQIGSGPDGLEWNKVRQLLEEIFKDDFHITIYKLDKEFVYRSKFKVEHRDLMLKDIDKNTGLLYIGHTGRELTSEMESINQEYPFLSRLKKTSYKLGTAFYTRIPHSDTVYGLICKDSINSLLSYEKLEQAINHLKMHNEKDKYRYFGLQAFKDNNDPYVMEKIETLFRNSGMIVEFWICWPSGLQRMHPKNSEQNNEDIQVVDYQCSSVEDRQSSSSKSTNFCKQPKKQKYKDCSPNVKNKSDSTQGQSDSHVTIDASGALETESSDTDQLAQPPKDVDSSFKTEDEGWPDESQWEHQDYAENERRKSSEKKHATRLNEEKQRQEKNNLGPKSCLTECQGDLFESEDTMCLAHCVGADFAMGAGIAVEFRQKFKSVIDLLAQNVRPGGVAWIKHEKRYVFYLVTKWESTGKPTYQTLERSLNALHEKCKELNITELAMPRIGCGLDRLEWSRVRPMIEDIFADGFAIKIYNLKKECTESKTSISKVHVKHEVLLLKDIESQTGLLYIGNVVQIDTPQMKSLDEKYHFLQRLDKSRPPKLGTVICTEVLQPREILYGLICQQSPNDPIDFNALAEALKSLTKMNKIHRYQYFGIEAFEDRNDPIIMMKIDTLFRNSYINTEIWICYPEPLANLMPSSCLARRSNEMPINSSNSYYGRGSWSETDSQQIANRLSNMERTQESMYRTMLKSENIRPEIMEILNQMEKKMALSNTATQDLFVKIDEVIIQDIQSLIESRENLKERVISLETKNNESEERAKLWEQKMEFLEQRVQSLEQMIMNSGYASEYQGINMNSIYPPSSFLDGSIPPAQDPAVGYQACPNLTDHHGRLIPAFPPSGYTNRQVYASEQFPAEKEALRRTALQFARKNNYEVMEKHGSAFIRKNVHENWRKISAYRDLDSL